MKIYRSKTMIEICERISILAEDGEEDYPAEVHITLNGKHPDCPVTIWRDKEPVFSMGVHEVSSFCESLQRLVADLT